jgi:hypothetical protein
MQVFELEDKKETRMEHGIDIDTEDTHIHFEVEKIGSRNTFEYILDYWMIVDVSVVNKFFNYHDKSETLEYRLKLR